MSPAPAARAGQPAQLIPTHCWNWMYSVMVPGADAPSQVGTHDWSFNRHVCVTQTAIDTQFGSFGQLVGPAQQAMATQAAHEPAATPKIWLAPAQVPASVAAEPLSVASPPPSPGAELPPPDTGATQGMPFVASQPAS